MTEGFAEWLAYKFLFTDEYRSSSGLFSKVRILAARVRNDSLPSLGKYLNSENYGHWQRMFGQLGLGYGAGELLVDYLLTENPVWTKKALEYWRKSGKGQKLRTAAFFNYVKNNWPGGVSSLEKEWEDWILNKEKELEEQEQ